MRRIFPKRAEPTSPVVDSLVVTEPETPETPVATVSDEGVPYLRMTHELIVNIATEFYDARRRELRVNGAPYAHVAETVDGQWIYRNDR